MTVALSQHLKPFKDALQSLAACDNPVFNDSKRKKDRRFKLTDRHRAMLGRMAKASNIAGPLRSSAVAGAEHK